MELLAAYLPLYLQRFQDAFGASGIGAPRLVHIQRDALHLHAAVLPDDYLLSLVTGPRGLATVSRRRLEYAARRLEREVLDAP